MIEPVSPSGGAGPLADFQAALRALRERAGNPSFRQMATRVARHYSTLARVEVPGRIPPRDAVLAYVEACRGDVTLWSRQYRDLRAALRTGQKVTFLPDSGADRPSPERRQANFERPVGPSADAARAFAKEMRVLRLHKGWTLVQVAERSRELVEEGRISRPVSVSSVSDLCNPELGRIPRRATVEAFLHVLDLPAELVTYWLDAHLVLSTVEETDLEAAVQTTLAVRNHLAHNQVKSQHYFGPNIKFQPGSSVRRGTIRNSDRAIDTMVWLTTLEILGDAGRGFVAAQDWSTKTRMLLDKGNLGYTVGVDGLSKLVQGYLRSKG
ncbi:helix-turn-helix domain-containing protein [Glycomyces sp. NPDC049804]|uniref:helix-turn-helix domain-containing protein n=1 Tax=Glycomyces sp. NPDC049804 TaxID=3154363 RepID=UPI003445E97C